MSFVTEVLSTAKTVKINNNSTQLPDLHKMIRKLRSTVVGYFYNIYVKFEVESNIYGQLFEEYYRLKQEIGNLSVVEPESTVEFKQIEGMQITLEECTAFLHLCSQLFAVHDNLQLLHVHMGQLNYEKAAHDLIQLFEVLETAGPDLQNLSSFPAIYERVLAGEQLLLSPILDIWNQFLEIELSVNKTTMKITTAQIENFERVVQVLALLPNKLASQTNEFSHFLMEHIFSPLIEFECLVENNNDIQACFEVTKISENQPVYSSVLERLGNIFEYLESYMNVAISENTTLLNLIGCQISNQFCHKLVNKCILSGVPASSTFSEYQQMAEAFKAFHEDLVEKSFLDETNTIIADRVSNIEQLHSNKLCRGFIERANLLMKKNLLDTIELTAERDFPIAVVVPFQTCQVSASIIELKELMHEVIASAAAASDIISYKLLVTFKNIVAMYARVMPQYHTFQLQNIPHQIALLYNNCQVLILIVEQIKIQYLLQLPTDKERGPLSFDDDVASLRNTSSDIILAELTNQKERLMNKINNFGVVCAGEDTAYVKMENSMCECIKQLEMLQTIWQNVLPDNIFNKSMGTLFDILVRELIVQLTNDSISRTTTMELIDCCTLVQEQGPLLFSEPTFVLKFCVHWRKFNDTISMLRTKIW